MLVQALDRAIKEKGETGPAKNRSFSRFEQEEEIKNIRRSNEADFSAAAAPISSERMTDREERKGY